MRVRRHQTDSVGETYHELGLEHYALGSVAVSQSDVGSAQMETRSQFNTAGS